jgi:hypothetical protein
MFSLRAQGDFVCSNIQIIVSENPIPLFINFGLIILMEQQDNISPAALLVFCSCARQEARITICIFHCPLGKMFFGLQSAMHFLSI